MSTHDYVTLISFYSQRFCHGVRLLEKVVLQDNLSTLVVNLYPRNEGYSLMLKGKISIPSALSVKGQRFIVFNSWQIFSIDVSMSSSETQGHIVGARERLNGWKKMAQRKVKNGEKSSSRRSLLFFAPFFSARLVFPLPPLSAPGSPRMYQCKIPIGFLVMKKKLMDKFPLISIMWDFKESTRLVWSPTLTASFFHLLAWVLLFTLHNFCASHI